MATRASWLEIPKGSHFSLANIPFGIVAIPPSTRKHAAIAIGDHVLDLHEFSSHGGFAELPELAAADIESLSQNTLNDFAALGQQVHNHVRWYLQNVFEADGPFPEVLKDNIERQRACLFRRNQVTMHMPMKITGYTDFFAGKNHAYNCGCIFRDPAKALQPNYLHLPVAYNSRASSVVVSGTDVRRPLGQFLDVPSATESSFGPCRRLDIELELGALLCKGNSLGEPINVNEAEVSSLAWEAVPLGPFNAKTFATTISPWVVLKDALEPFRVSAMSNEMKPHPYLAETRKDNVYSIELEVELITANGDAAVLSRTNGRNLVFSFAQMIAHHTIGGCSLDVGDLIGSGTISGTEAGSLGSLLEASNGGKKAYLLSPGIERTFLEDGDRVTIRGWCGGEDDSELVGFGECAGLILPAPKPSWLND